ncbi:MAG TPA: DUF4430 domain-containing protein [Candidatus Paceibacterota bacterium]
MDLQFRKTLKLFTVLFGVLAFGVLLGVSLADMGYAPTGTQAEREEILVDLEIDYGNGDEQSFPGKLAGRGDTVLDVLDILERQNGITIEKRNFPGLGVFIEAIHGVENTNNSYWQFWVNGEYSQVGAGQYELKDGDKVLWKRTSERPE